MFKHLRFSDQPEPVEFVDVSLPIFRFHHHAVLVGEVVQLHQTSDCAFLENVHPFVFVHLNQTESEENQNE